MESAADSQNSEQSGVEAKQVNVEAYQAPSHLRAMQVLAEGYQGYMSYLKNGGQDGISTLLGELIIEF